MKTSLLFAIAAIAAATGIGLVLWFLGRGLGRLFDRPRIPRAGGTYFFFGTLCAASLVLAASSVGLARLLDGHTRVDGPTRLGDLRCEALAGGRVRTTFVAAGTVTREEESVEEEAPGCRIEAALVTMRPLPPPIGVVSLSRVTQIGHKPLPDTEQAWWGPAIGFFPGLLVRGRVSSEASATPEDKTVFSVVATPGGVVLEKRGG